MQDRHEIGAELRAALEARGCALSAAEARALSVSLIGLIASGLLFADTSTEAVHGSRARSSAGTGGGFDGLSETVPAYNMGQSVYGEGSER